MTLAFVGLGANLGEPRRQLDTAIEALKGLPDTAFLKVSACYRSAPLGYLEQPDFLNAVALLDTQLSAEQLLEDLQAIERRHGRVRSFAGAPRTLDLDLLLYGERVLCTPRLALPHPRMHERAFVLQPLLDLDSEISIPGKGKARDLLSACGSQEIERIDG
ncbi:MAG: 2-amino-4-hydroxy-6-hydroxymethyldihydropteridine diphosphokinase [Burkholderiales bacterium]